MLSLHESVLAGGPGHCSCPEHAFWLGQGLEAVRALEPVSSGCDARNAFPHPSIHPHPLQTPPPPNWSPAPAFCRVSQITVSDECNVTYKDPDEEGLMKFLCEEKMFARDRVEKGLKKLVESKERKTQGRLDSFFTVQPKAPGDLKRKAVDVKLPPGKKPVLGKKAIGGKKK